MGWEYDGGEAEFNEFVNQNSFEDNYDTNNNYESIKSVKSKLYNDLNGVEYLEEIGNKVRDFDRFRDLWSRIYPFLSDSHDYLYFDSDGEYIEYMDSYKIEVENKNPTLFRKRKSLHDLRIFLIKKFRIKEYSLLRNSRTKHIEWCQHDGQVFDDEFVFDVISGRVTNDYFDNSNFLIRLMYIANLCVINKCNDDTVYYELILPEYNLEKYSDSIISRNIVDNPFWEYVGKEECCNGMSRIIQKLGNVFDLIRGLIKHKVKDFPNFTVQLEESGKKIRLESERYIFTIEENVGEFKEIIFDFNFFIHDDLEVKERITKFSTDDYLTPLNKYDKYELDIINKEEIKSKKNNLNIDELIKRGNILVRSNDDFKTFLYVGMVRNDALDFLFEKSKYITDGMMYSSELKLELGTVIYVNSFQFKLLKNEHDLYDLTGLGNESGDQLLRDAQVLIGRKVNYRPDNSAATVFFKHLLDLEDVILSINNNLPSIEKNDYDVGDYLIIFNLFAKIKLDCLGHYYISPLEDRSISSFFVFFNLDKFFYLKEILGYSIVSQNIVCRSLEDLNNVITQIQKKIVNYSYNKQYLLEVGDKIQLGKFDLTVKFYEGDWSKKVARTYKLGYFYEKDDTVKFTIDDYDCFIRLDNFSKNVLNFQDEVNDCDSLFHSNSLEDLTLKVKLFKLEIEKIKQNNDFIIEPLRVFKIGEKSLIYFKDKELGWCISGEGSVKLWSGMFNTALMNDLFDCFDGSVEELSNRILGYYNGNDKKVFFKRESDLVLFISEVQKKYYKSLEIAVDYKMPENLIILSTGDLIILEKKRCLVEKNENGYYLKSAENFSQNKLISDFFTNCFVEVMGYFDGGVFPYCRSLSHLSYFIHCMDERSKINKKWVTSYLTEMKSNPTT